MSPAPLPWEPQTVVGRALSVPVQHAHYTRQEQAAGDHGDDDGDEDADYCCLYRANPSSPVLPPIGPREGCDAHGIKLYSVLFRLL